jgi:hypothetical protein
LCVGRVKGDDKDEGVLLGCGRWWREEERRIEA